LNVFNSFNHVVFYYALQEFSAQTLSSRIGKKTKFKFLQLEGEIDEDIIENIENYLNDFWFSLFCLNALNA
jgi:hypothetical protein